MFNTTIRCGIFNSPVQSLQGCYPVEAPFAVDVLQHRLVQTQLQTGLVKHLPLVRVAGDEPVHFHRLPLANPVAASLRLEETHSGAERLQQQHGALLGKSLNAPRSSSSATRGRQAAGLHQTEVIFSPPSSQKPGFLIPGYFNYIKVNKSRTEKTKRDKTGPSSNTTTTVTAKWM